LNRGQLIQGHSKCISDIIVVDKIEDRIPSGSKAAMSKSENDEENSEKRTMHVPPIDETL
jgi:hypothetical protein